MAPSKIKQDVILEIPLCNDRIGLARVLAEPFIAVFDFRGERTQIPASADEIPVLFVIAVHQNSLRDWKIVADVGHTKKIKIPEQFMQDEISPQECQIINADGEIRAATTKECEGLEPAAVWEASHIVSRLNDYFSGRPNAFVEQMKLIQP